jgi:hypothetical protein
MQLFLILYFSMPSFVSHETFTTIFAFHFLQISKFLNLRNCFKRRVSEDTHLGEETFLSLYQVK